MTLLQPTLQPKIKPKRRSKTISNLPALTISKMVRLVGLK